VKVNVTRTLYWSTCEQFSATDSVSLLGARATLTAVKILVNFKLIINTVYYGNLLLSDAADVLCALDPLTSKLIWLC